jgi:hypothetical protein
MPLNKHICVTHIHLFEGAPTPACTECGVPISIYTNGRHAHVLTKAELFHIQGMLHGILGGNCRGFVRGIRVPMSVELTCYSSSLLVILYVLFQGFH